MKTGDIVYDEQERAYKVGLLLGRGLWGKTYRVQCDHLPGDLLLKCPLTIDDLPAGLSEADKLEKACREILVEQAEFLAERAYPFLPTVVSHFTTSDGGMVMLLERLPGSLEQSMAGGASLRDCLSVLAQAGRLCQQLKDGPGCHGALKPTNVLLDADGGVVLSDVSTPSLRRTFPRLLQARGPEHCYLPPETTDAKDALFSPTADTYALGMMLWRIVLGFEDARPLPREGLERAALVSLKDRLHARIKQEDSNPRFHGRLAERLAATISRAASLKASPSPPYRFNRHDELVPRLEELLSLVRPEVVTVGRVILERPPNSSHFSTDEKVRYTISVGCSAGVDSHEEIACGVAIFDRDTAERVREVPSTYDVSRHPSGRFRFQFELSDLRPGNYRLRAAFAIRDSGREPTVKEAELEIRAAHGYIPPPERPPSAALPIPEEPGEARVATEPLAQLPEPPSPAPPPPPEPTPQQLPQEPAPTVAEPRPEQAGTPSADTWVTRASTVSFGGGTQPASQADTAVPMEQPRVAPERSRQPAPRPDLSPAPDLSAAAAAQPEPVPEPAALSRPEPQLHEEPEPAGLSASGSWTDLPLSEQGHDDLTDLGDDYDDLDEFAPRSPWGQLLDMVRGDAWAMFMIGAAVVAVVLLFALFLLKN